MLRVLFPHLCPRFECSHDVQHAHSSQDCRHAPLLHRVLPYLFPSIPSLEEVAMTQSEPSSNEHLAEPLELAPLGPCCKPFCQLNIAQPAGRNSQDPCQLFLLVHSHPLLPCLQRLPMANAQCSAAHALLPVDSVLPQCSPGRPSQAQLLIQHATYRLVLHPL